MTINQQGEVHLGFDARAVFDVDAVDLFAGLTGLLGHQCAAQHLLGFFSGFFNRFGQAHATGFASAVFFECAFAATTCVDLRFHHPEWAVHLACFGFGLFRLQHNAAVGHRSAVAAQQGLRLILVDVHRSNVPSVANIFIDIGVFDARN